MKTTEETKEFVISGISGRFPESDNLEEFWDNLINGVDMIRSDDRRWPNGFCGTPSRKGTLKADLSKFDANFFKINAKAADKMDPQLRLLLEVSYEAIIDAGINPVKMRGSNTGVFVGSSSSEVIESCRQNPSKVSGYDIPSSASCMFSNRLSYAFDFHGPSLTLDTYCSSSLMAFHQALTALKSGQCDAALVAGINLLLNPLTSLQMLQVGTLSPDGSCKAFDAAANGYVRSEAIVAVFLQRESDARRVYAHVVHSKANADGYKSNGVSYPSGKVQRKLIEETYAEAGVDPGQVIYVEAHGTGTKAGDPEEIGAISQALGGGRSGDQPLLVGSVKSNMGHAEGAASLCSVAKVVLALQRGVIPGNLHFYEANSNIPQLIDGTVKVVSQNTPLGEKGLVSLNATGIGGSNIHVILRSPDKHGKVLKAFEIERKLPTIVPFSGRTEDGLRQSLQKICDQDEDSNLHFLLQKIFKVPIGFDTFRGYCIPEQDSSIQIGSIGREERPLWFIFSGMGTQWCGMANELLNFHVFEQSISKSSLVVSPLEIDLFGLITTQDETLLRKHMALCFVAVGIGLVDLLTSVGLTPTGLIGHSAGELLCGYTDKSLSRRDCLLSFYYKDLCVSKLCGGGMAAIGLTWSDAVARCPPDIYPACHNASDNVTISGPIVSVQKFVKELNCEGIFAREVYTQGVAYHSPYLGPSIDEFNSYLQSLITDPKPRSKSWISTSIPDKNSNGPFAQHASADYIINNYQSPVLFADAVRKIPENAVVLEVSASAIFQSILTRSLPPNCSVLGLMKKNQEDNALRIVNTLGQLYNLGYDLKLEKLYPKVELPVPSGTAMIAHLVQWDHSQSFQLPHCIPNGNSGDTTEISVSKDEYSFLIGHKIDGRIIFPATGYLVLAWRKLANMYGKPMDQFPIQFRKVRLERATILSLEGWTKLEVNLVKATGDFQITEGDSIVASGNVQPLTDEAQVGIKKDYANLNPNYHSLREKDVYKELRLRGYEYQGVFKGIHSINLEGDEAIVSWKENFISFLDTLIQFPIVRKPTRGLYLPTRIDKVLINPQLFFQSVKTTSAINAKYCSKTERISCPGIEFQRIKMTLAPSSFKRMEEPILEEYKFVPYINKSIFNKAEIALKICVDIFLENICELDISVGEFTSCVESTENSWISKVTQFINQQPCFHTVNTSRINFPLGEKSNPVSSPLLDHPHKVMSKVFPSCSKDLKGTTHTNYLNEANLTGKGTIDKEMYKGNFHLVLSQLETLIDIFSQDESFPKNEKSHNNSETCEINFFGKKYHSNFEDSKSESKLDWVIKPNGYFLLSSSSISKKVSDENGDLNLHGYHLPGFALITRQSYLFSEESDGEEKIGTFALYQKMESQRTTETKTVEIKSHPDYTWINPLQKCLEEQVPSTCPELLCIKEESACSGIVGLINCLRREPGGRKLRCFFSMQNELRCKNPTDLLANLSSSSILMNIINPLGLHGSFRHLPLNLNKPTDEINSSTTKSFLIVNIMTKGDLSSLRWIEQENIFENSGPSSNICEVHYAPLNFRDVMLATGKLPPDALPGNLAQEECLLGLEFSGIIAKGVWTGKRVMGAVEVKGMSTFLQTDPLFLWECPHYWTLEQGATVPVAYLTAYYALIIRGNLQPKESILIHSGSGGVGQAAIRIALSMQCTIYTTVGSKEKIIQLQQLFPQLTEKNFSNSRDLSFERHILLQTEGQGVDVILNSLSQEKLESSLRCLGQGGRFLEIGKFDLSKDTSLGMSVFLRNISFHGILLDALFKPQNDFALKEKKRLVQLVQDGISEGVVQPLRSTLFQRDQLEQGFRFMASGKHMGKVLFQIRDELRPESETFKGAKTVTRIYFDASKSYVIVGGLGGFGLELADWMVSRGARNLIFNSRSGVTTGYQRLAICRWVGKDVKVRVDKSDLSDLDKARELLESAEWMGPLGGIFNLAMVLNDGLFSNQREDTFLSVCSPKITITQNLDKLSQQPKYNSHLEHFVVFSSVSCGRGNAGQSNYAYGNSAAERICELRRSGGYPALAIQWGAIGDVGVVQEQMTLNKEPTDNSEVIIGGTLPQKVNSCLEVLDTFLRHQNELSPVVSSYVVPKKEREKSKSGSGGQSALTLTFKVAKVLGLRDPGAITRVETPLVEFGLDSLMSVEIKQLLERMASVVLSTQDIRKLNWGDIQAFENKSNEN